MSLAVLLAVALRIDPHVAARFDPRSALGATIDVHAERETRSVLAPSVVAKVLSAGFQPLSYRLATELGGEAWHWNPRGTWSDAAHHEGYWTSSADLGEPIAASYGYRLPRRGNTIDQSRNNGWSRIDDGDADTFWKSNPYLGERPQWVLIDLGAYRAVDRVDISWGEPRAIAYEVQCWRGEDPINLPADGRWAPLGRGGTARYVRVWMTKSAPAATPVLQGDWRDHTGFAIREIFVRRGNHDWVHHAPSHAQTVVWVSSTDPWHRAIDIDRSMEQPGLDAVFASGLTRGLPMLTPVALLYGTPDDAAAEIAYLRARSYNVAQVELGEEPDGQNAEPEDYASLYARFADAIHRVAANVQLGGPSLQSTRDVVAFWPDQNGRTSWMARFLAALGDHRRDFNFFSFEWYPIDDVCSPEARQLAVAPRILDRVLDAWRREGVPQDIPWIVSEYGWSSYAARAEVDLPGALFDVEFVAHFLLHGGSAAYFYGSEPNDLFTEKCGQYGALTLFLGGRRVPAYYAARLLTQEWLQPRGVHELHTVSGLPRLVRAFAVRRPDGSWATLIVNMDPRRGQSIAARGEVVQYSREQYVWKAHGANGRATRNDPPKRFHATGIVRLPPYSITVVRARSGKADLGPPAQGQPSLDAALVRHARHSRRDFDGRRADQRHRRRERAHL